MGIYTYVDIYVCTYKHMYVCIYVCIYTYIYIYMLTPPPSMTRADRACHGGDGT